MRVNNYRETVEALYPRLDEYLEEQGIDPTKLFKCLSPNHDDSNPSCGIVDSREAWHCFGCGSSGTIFNAANVLEDKPINGLEFITDTLSYLAEKYGVPLDHEPPTEEELYELDTYRAYRAASELVLSGTQTEAFVSAISTRGWSEATCKELGIGSLKEFRGFRESLKQAGFTATFLDDIDLNRKGIFGGPERLIFTIRDVSGRPVGFTARDLNFQKGDTGAKYINTDAKCNIYQKSKRLFGLDLFLANKGKKNVPLYLFEGNGDVATGREHGLNNCCGIGGTSLTQDHVTLIKDLGIHEVILCLDGDEQGQKAIARILDTTLSGHKDLKISIVIIPEEKDPDDFISLYGLEKFKALRQHSAFEWRLNQFDDQSDTQTVCESMIPLIVNETSFIRQESMCVELSKFTDYSLRNIQSELTRLQEKKAEQMERDRKNVADELIKNLKRNPKDIQHLIQEADLNLYDLSRKHEEDALSEDSFVARVMEQKSYEETLDGSFAGFVLSPRLRAFQKNLGGNWKRDVWMAFGGKPNSGKTSFLSQLMWDIATHEKENNACVIYHTIDDTFEQVLPKFVCLANGEASLELNHVMNPNFASRDNFGNNIVEDRDTGYNKVIEMGKRGRLVIKDANDGLSLAFADNLIRRMKEKYPDRDIVYVLDNFHKLSDFQGLKNDERTRFKLLSTAMKGLATKHHCCVMTTVEYRKTQDNKKAGNQDISETIQIEYDANLIAHVHNELHDRGPASTTVHRDKDDIRLPIIQIEIGKNKITAFKESLFFEFWPASSLFDGIPPETVAHLRRKEKERQGEDTEDYKLVYRECADLVKEKGWQASKVAFMMAERVGLNPEDPDEKKKMWDIFTKCGGPEGVYASA